MDDLLQKIKKIEALIAGAKTDGEKSAAMSAKDRILKKYPGVDIHKDAIEFTLYTTDSWNKKLLVAICRKYGLRPYRYHRQKYTTVMVRANEDFLNNILWKEYLDYSKKLGELVTEITDELISKIHKHEDEEIIRGELK